jgi:hypothetical protein
MFLNQQLPSFLRLNYSDNITNTLDDDDDVYLIKLQHGSGLQNLSPY